MILQKNKILTKFINFLSKNLLYMNCFILLYLFENIHREKNYN